MNDKRTIAISKS